MSEVRTQRLAAWAVIAGTCLLAGCSSVRQVQTTGPAPAGQVKPTAFALEYQTAMDGTLSVSVRTTTSPFNSNPSPQLHPQTQAKLFAEARRHTQMMEKGLRERFPEEAARYKIKIVPAAGAPADMPVLTVRVPSVQGHCPGLGCYAVMRVAASVRGPNLKYWSTFAEVGPNAVGAPFEEPQFDEFARKLLDTMVKDGVIEKP